MAIRMDEAHALIEANCLPVCEAEEVGLDQALGRVLADDVVSAVSVPPAANSAVDGYAVRHVDLSPQGETVLPLVGRSVAGHPGSDRLAPRTAMRILTGALMPEGADTVMMQEDARVDEGTVILQPGIAPGANSRSAGEDVAVGTRVLAAGQRLRPQDVAIAAAVGCCRVAVRRRLRVAICSTGDELVDPASGDLRGNGRAARGRIFDSNRPMLRALLQGVGAEITDCGILPDIRDRIAATLEDAARQHDLVLTSGGVSVGEEDHVRAALDEVGRIDFWRLAVRPGRPVALGEIGGAPVVCLPGNPVAAMVTFIAIVRPLLACLGGAHAPPLQRFPVEAGFSIRKRRGRREFVRVRLRQEAGALPLADRFPRDGAGILSSLVFADGLVDLAEETESVTEGDTIAYLPFSGLFT